MTDGAFPILTVSDLSAARSFYERLGFVQTYQFPPQGEPGFVALERDGSVLGLGASGDGDGDADRFSYWVYLDGPGQVDAAFAALTAAGAPVVAEPADQPWGERLAQVRDPAGTLVHLGATVT
jgi:uncharacterized glyoxalase superfamily protein PhnB